MKTAFLNGELGFHDRHHEMYFNLLNREGEYVMLIDNLFNQPHKLDMLRKYDVLVIGSTGFEVEKLDKLFDEFIIMGYIPKEVVFAPSEDPFLSIIRKMAGNGILYYRLEYIDFSRTPLTYLNKPKLV